MKKQPFPIHLEIELTNICQLKCPMCPRLTMKREEGLMTYPLFTKIIDQARGKVKTCYLHMFGDPLIHPWLCDYVRYANQAGIRTSISTNAMLLTKEVGQQLLDAKIDEVILSLDSMKKDVYESLRVGADFDTVINNIGNFIELRRTNINSKTEIQLCMIKMKENESEVEAFEAKYRNLLRSIGTVNIKQFSTWAGNVEDRSPTKTLPRRYNCPKTAYSLAIYWNGEVVICCRDCDGATIVGDVRKQTIQEIWDSKKLEDIRKSFRTKQFIPFCKNC